MLITYHLDHLSASIFFFPLVFSNSFLLLCLASFYCVLEIVCETAQTATEANCFQGQLVLSSCCAGTEWDWSLPFTQTGLELRWMKSTLVSDVLTIVPVFGFGTGSFLPTLWYYGRRQCVFLFKAPFMLLPSPELRSFPEGKQVLCSELISFLVCPIAF